MKPMLDEKILVVKRSLLFTHQAPWQGIDHACTESIVKTIIQDQEYIPRSLAEIDTQYKQIIPYMIFTHNNLYFVMERKATASEQRLAGKLSLGIGGHMRKEDMQGQTIFDWAQREFTEEVSYKGNLTIKTLGILNDDSDAVGLVHLGIIMLAEGDNDQISIKDEHKQGILLSKDQCLEKLNQFENWSKYTLKLLK